jgi:hypothetical protein
VDRGKDRGGWEKVEEVQEFTKPEEEFTAEDTESTERRTREKGLTPGRGELQGGAVISGG